MTSLSRAENKFNTNQASLNRHLCFSLGDENFAIPLLQVKEVIQIPEFTRIPYVPSYFCGIMNLRGKVISVIDFSKKLSINSTAHEERSVIVCDLEHIVMGIMVDSVDMVINIENESIVSKPNVNTNVKLDFIDGFFYHKEKLIAFINLIKSLSLEDILNIQKSVE